MCGSHRKGWQRCHECWPDKTKGHKQKLQFMNCLPLICVAMVHEAMHCTCDGARDGNGGGVEGVAVAWGEGQVLLWANVGDMHASNIPPSIQMRGWGCYIRMTSDYSPTGRPDAGLAR